MSDGEYDLIGPDGMPDGRVDIDILTANALRVAGRLAIASREEGDVAEIIRAEVAANGLPPMLKATFAALVIQEMTLELFAPMFTALQVDHLDTDFISQLQQRSGITKDIRGPQHGDTSPEGEH